MPSYYLVCFSGYGKGGPCPSKDTWLLQIDRAQWERLSECPTTKTGAAMVALPSFSACASMGQDAFAASAGMNSGAEPAVALLWSGREHNPSSIRVRRRRLTESIASLRLVLCRRTQVLAMKWQCSI